MDGQLDTSSPEPAGLEEHGSDPSSRVTGVVDDKVGASNSPSKRSRRAVMKRVVTVPVADIEGSRLKGEGAPPPDSWSWRKYGQKPIKGSPYPRNYYRCSSSKGCPARKQVERSRANPTMLVITYASDHNHSWSSSTRSSPSTVAVSSVVTSPPSPASPKLPAALSSPSVAEDDDKFGAAVRDDALLHEEFAWFSDISAVPQGESTLHSPICGAGAGEGGCVVYQMGEEEESLFADLGELPECSVVLRTMEDGRRVGLAAAAPWCGTTG